MLHLFLFLIEIWSKTGKILSMKFGVWIDKSLLYYFLYSWSTSSVYFKNFNEEPESQVPSWTSLGVWADCCSLLPQLNSPGLTAALSWAGRQPGDVNITFILIFTDEKTEAQNIWHCSGHTQRLLDFRPCHLLVLSPLLFHRRART